MYRQYFLRMGSKRMVTWLRSADPLRPGMLVRLKGQSALWTVESASRMALPCPPERTWRVGGIA